MSANPAADATPLISVALCTYNGARFLREQLDSLCAQDYPHFEIVAVDDASTDDTVAILRDYAARDPRLSVHVNRTNRGYTANFAHALTSCRGSLIAPCDQDDVWDPRKLTLLANARAGADLVYCDSELMDASGRSLAMRVSDRAGPYRGSDPRVFTFHNCISGHALLCTRALIDRSMPYPPGCFHDHWLAFVAASLGRIEYLDVPLVRYRQHPSAVTDISGLKGRVRQAGFRFREVESQTRWLAGMAALKSPHQPFFQQLLELWAEWRARYFAPRLMRFLLEHRGVLFALPPKNDVWRRARARRMFWGLKTRQIMQPFRYRPPKPPISAAAS